jgi:CheY-like chemotaxis protein
VARILVADDRAASRELIRSMLECDGHDVVEAENGAEVLVLIAEKAPDLILLDLQMPIMDGFAVVREMRTKPQYAGIPIIALTASAMLGDRERALQEGFTGYITKPIRLGALRLELERHLMKTP